MQIDNLSLVVAIDNHRGIGFNGKIPWNSKADMKYFKALTSNKAYFKNAVVMGRKTFDSIGKVLDNRLNIVITKHLEPLGPDGPDGSDSPIFVKSPDLAIEYCQKNNIDNIFVIGGSQIYEQFMPFASCLYVSHMNINSHVICDTYFPEIPDYFRIYSSSPLVGENGSFEGTSVCYKRVQCVSNFIRWPDEHQYLEMVRKILEEGSLKSNRTDTGAVSIFGHSSKWCLKDNKFPLLTTKKVFSRGVIEELLWFISGSTNSKVLEEKGVKIWMPNTTREFLDNRGLVNYKEGDIGAGYGFQWRHSGADYNGHDVDYTGKGVDQIKDLVDGLKNDPDSRRHIICSWNPSALSKMALPPCHVLFQAYVVDKTLHTILYQRSADVGLGVPFNIASYALFTRMLAHCCDLNPGTFTHYTGDTHIYESHITAMKTQMFRMPRESPKLFIKTDNKDIFSMTFSDFEIVDYEPHDIIKMNMIA